MGISVAMDQITELTKMVSLPLPPLHHSHLALFADLLEEAYKGIKADYAATVGTENEAQITSLMVSRLRNMLAGGSPADLLIANVSRGSETCNYDGTHIEKRPDIQISLHGKMHSFPLIVESKLLDKPNMKTIDLYCDEGLSRFTIGDYAWANCEAIMLGYVRDGSEINTTLTPYLDRASKKSPPEFAVVALPTACHGASAKDVLSSVHGRYFKYAHPNQANKPPGDICIWHVWVS